MSQSVKLHWMVKSRGPWFDRYATLCGIPGHPYRAKPGKGKKDIRMFGYFPNRADFACTTVKRNITCLRCREASGIRS